MPENFTNTLLVILGFAAMVLAPVLAAHFIGARKERKRKGDSGSRPAFRVVDPAAPKGGEHLRPRPRRRGLR